MGVLRRLTRRLAFSFLAPWLSRDEREEVLEDLKALSETVSARRGPLIGGAWVLWQLLLFPLYLWRSGRRGLAMDRGIPTSGRGTLESWIREIRRGGRRALRRPGASAVIVFTLAMGIGASASVFSVLNTLVLKPLPFRDPSSLVRVRESLTVQSGVPPREVSMAPRRFEQLRDRSRAFEDVAAVRFRTFTLTGDGEPERIVGLTATWNYFSVLGVTPAFGRTFAPEEDLAGAPAPVAVISRSLWARRFGQDPDVVGSELEVNGRPHTVVGVMPGGFRYPYAGELWIPMGIDPGAPDYEDRGLNITARLVSTATMASARAEMETLSEALAGERPDTDANMAFTFKTIEEEILEGVPRKVSALLWAAVLVLLIGAANIASMILARLHGEARELTVQVALGAGRGDLSRRFLAESFVLMALGLFLGLTLSGGSVGFLTRLSPVSDLGPYFQDVGVDLKVAAFGSILALAAVLLASLPTAVQLKRGEYASTLRSRSIGTGRGPGGIRFLDFLVAGEVAVAVILLTGAGLTVESVRAEWESDLGIDLEGLTTFAVAPGPSGYEEWEERVTYMDALLERVQAVPGVEAAGYTNLNPMRSHGWGASVWPEGRTPTGRDDVFTLNHRAVSPGYFEAAGTRILSGRRILPSDGSGDPGVVVVSQGAARLFWPDEDPIGKRIRAGGANAGGPLLTVVGVAEDVKEFEFLSETWYRPLKQDPRDYNTRVLELFVRGSEEDAVLVPSVRRAMREVDPDVPIFNVQAMTDVLRFERRVESFATLLLALFAGIGIVLAAVGIYGILSYTTGRRAREIGLRVALGASRREVVYDVTARTLKACGSGLAVGFAGAAFLAVVLESLVVEVQPFSPGVYGVAVSAALAVAVVAGVGPVLKALRIHPRTALAGD